jgi:uncharacterized protein YkwD
MKKRMLFSLLFAALVSVSCSKAEGLSDPPTGSDLKAPISVNKEMLLQLVNDARKKGCQCGDTYYAPAPVISWNDMLEKAAFHHAKDMSRNDYFSHTGKDGTTVSQRMERVGYHWKVYGENIGMGYKDEREVIEGWLRSPGHCKNIMNMKFKEMAVAHVGNYWTQTFGAR